MNNPCVGFGSRTFDTYVNNKIHASNLNKMELLYNDAIKLCGEATEGVEGGAYGADRLFCILMLQKHIPVRTMAADWAKFGKSAGVLRNKQMADYIRENEGYAIGLWDGKSRGTAHMMDYCQRWGIPTIVHSYNVSENKLSLSVYRFNI